MKTKILSFIIIVALSFSSCKDFLEEEFYSGSSIELLVSTPSGVESLISACYVPTKVFFGKEYGWDLSTTGTDLWTYAGDADEMKALSQYSDYFSNETPGRLALVWAEFYKAVNTCNTALKYLPDAKVTDDIRAYREGEVKFLRALYYFYIVETWGKVAFSDAPITEPKYTLERSPIMDFYTLILNDLDDAIDLLPLTAKGENFGRIHKYAAYALRARANLYYASEYQGGNFYDQANAEDFINIPHSDASARNHITEAISDAQIVIDNANYSLYTNYYDNWLMENNISSGSAEHSESIWSINYSNSIYAVVNLSSAEYDFLRETDPKPLSEREGGCHGHMMFGMRWFNIGGVNSFMLKDDGIDGCWTEPTRPFARYMPTRFLVDLFDESVDQRWEDSFNNTFFVNNTGSDPVYQIPKWPAGLYLADGTPVPFPDKKNTPMMELGDTAFVVLKEKTLDPSEYYVYTKDQVDWKLHATKNYFMVDKASIYNEDGSVNESGSANRLVYYDLKKWYDSTRTHNGLQQDVYGSQNGQRDFIVLRLSEMYLIAAEASLLNDDKAMAYSYLEELGNARAKDGSGANLLAAYGINGSADVDIDFILDERGRELCGEQQRWFDLKRTGKLIERVKAHNPDALDISEKHLVRPIPQIELDAIENQSYFEEGWGIY